MASTFTAAVHLAVDVKIVKYLIPTSTAYTLTVTDVNGGTAEFTIYCNSEQPNPQLETLFQSQEDSLRIIKDCRNYGNQR